MAKNFIQDIADKIQEALPEGVKNAQGEIERFVKEGVDSATSNFKFVKYDEFEIQQKILLKTREKLEILTKRVEALEAMIAKLETINSGEMVIEETAVIELNDKDEHL